MSYWVLTIFTGLISIIVLRLILAKPKPKVPEPEEDKVPANEPLPDSPQKVADWILKIEKSRTEVKEELSRPPTYSERFYGRD
jgi:hypothetical protein